MRKYFLAFVGGVALLVFFTIGLAAQALTVHLAWITYVTPFTMNVLPLQHCVAAVLLFNSFIQFPNLAKGIDEAFDSITAYAVRSSMFFGVVWVLGKVAPHTF